MNIKAGFIETIGNTPLVKLQKASQETGCTILGKAEFLNPGGSIKDRAALSIIRDAEKNGQLKQNGTIVEGTAGNTGIGLTLVGNALGYKTVIVMPRTQSQEKKDALRLAGADLHLVDAKPYKDPDNYIHFSKRLATKLALKEPNGAIWANQFDNLANRDVHFKTTGPEVWTQTNGKIDGFTCAVGSGGSIGGISLFLKERDHNIKIALADPMGASLYSYYKYGELKSEGASITEGIGQGRITENLKDVEIDDAYQISDEEALKVLFDLIKDEGLLLGGSSGINVAAAVRMAQEMGPGHTIVTLLCDGGARYQSKLYNPTFLKEKGLPYPEWLEERSMT